MSAEDAGVPVQPMGKTIENARGPPLDVDCSRNSVALSDSSTQPLPV